MLNMFRILDDLKMCRFTVKLLSITFLVTLYTSDVCSQKPPVVKTLLGELSGYYMKTRGGRQIAAFTAIPYAIPPVGELRFKVAVPVEPWQDTLDATKVTPFCVQRHPYIRQKEIVGQEDCLYLNIYTPITTNNSIDKKKLLPVIVFIHGGSFMCGATPASRYGPEYLLDRDVLLVTVNYRLGPLGFLSTLDEQCPGNNGLKDQLEALRFIQKTIESFGGDKDSVTILGESSGGASAHYHMISEMSAGLFHKAISTSGTALVPWAEAPPGEALRNAFRLAKILKCPQAPSEKMLACLRTKDSYDIIDTEFDLYMWDYDPLTPFKVVVEPNLPGAFLKRSASKVPDVPALPWMTGFNKNEGCLKSVWITTNESRYQEFMSAFDTIAPVTFYYEYSPYVEEITKGIREKYLKGNDLEAKSGILDMYTDSYFAFPTVAGVELVFNYTKNPIYLYELAYRATNSFSQIFGDPDGNHGVCHADDLLHLFPVRFLLNPISPEDIKMSETVVTLFTNFATSGNPNEPVPVSFNWKPASGGQHMEYLEIQTESKMKNDLASRSRYWGTLPLWHNKRNNRLVDEL